MHQHDPFAHTDVQNPSDQATPEKPDRFTPHSGTLVFGALCIAAVALSVFDVRGFNTEAVKPVAMGGAFVFALVYGVSSLAFRFGRRSMRAGNVTFVALFTLWTAGMGVLYLQARGDSARTDEMKQTAQSVIDTARRDLANGETSTATLDAQSELLDRFEQADDAMSPDDQRVMRVITGFARDIHEMERAYMALGEGATFQSFLSFTEPAQFDAAVEEIHAMRDSKERYLELIRGAGDDLSARFRSAGVPDAVARDAMRGFADGARFDLVGRIAQLEIDMLDQSEQLVGIGRRTLGKRTVTDDGSILFDASVPDSTIDEFNAAQARIMTAANTQANLIELKLAAFQESLDRP